MVVCVEVREQLYTGSQGGTWVISLVRQGALPTESLCQP